MLVAHPKMTLVNLPSRMLLPILLTSLYYIVVFLLLVCLYGIAKFSQGIENILLLHHKGIRPSQCSNLLITKGKPTRRSVSPFQIYRVERDYLREQAA